MRLGLSQIIDRPGESISYSAVVDLSDLQYGTSFPVTEPVKAEGTVRNTAGVLVMKGTITTCIHGICDRCTAAWNPCSGRKSSGQYHPGQHCRLPE